MRKSELSDPAIIADLYTHIRRSLVATVIAWGAKFSEHPLLIKDRERNHGQSALAKALINRARDLAEDLKVHRIPTADHVVVALLIEPMQNRECPYRAPINRTH